MRKIWIALLIFAPWIFAQTGNCKEVSGAILTNFLLDETGTVVIDNGRPMQFYATTLGTATGDLRGAIGVYVLTPLIPPPAAVTVHHHWVTEAGDTIFLEDTSAPLFPILTTNVVATVNYVVSIKGGTGRFAGAKGQIQFFGGTDFTDPMHPLGILRYRGNISFAQE